jgi:hypothetical protein
VHLLEARRPPCAPCARSRAWRFDRTTDPQGGRKGVPAVTGPRQVCRVRTAHRGVVRAERPPLRPSGGRGHVRSGVAASSRFPEVGYDTDVRPRRVTTTAHRPRPDRCRSKSAGRGLGPERTWPQGGQTNRARSCGPGDRGSGPRHVGGCSALARSWKRGAPAATQRSRRVAYLGRKCTRQISVERPQSCSVSTRSPGCGGWTGPCRSALLPGGAERRSDDCVRYDDSTLIAALKVATGEVTSAVSAGTGTRSSCVLRPLPRVELT